LIVNDVAERESLTGEKMIEVRVRFWTNNLASSKTQVVPKHARTGGVVSIERNKTHDITPRKRIPFNSLMELTSAIEKVLLAHGIELHPSRRMRKYISESSTRSPD
jgi:hypothetical protein